MLMFLKLFNVLREVGIADCECVPLILNALDIYK